MTSFVVRARGEWQFALWATLLSVFIVPFNIISCPAYTHFALTGERWTDETIFGKPVDNGGTGDHVSAFSESAEVQDGVSSLREEERGSRRSSISTIAGNFRTHARKAVKKSHEAVKKLVPPGKENAHEPKWHRVEDCLSYLHEKDAQVLKDTLEVSKQNYDGGKLYLRKIHVGHYGEVIEWQVKFDHKTRGCQEQARALKDAARKVKSYLDFKEPGELDERFKRLYEIIRDDKRYVGGLILFKEGKGKDWYPWKVRIQHELRDWTTVSNTLFEAITAMEQHLEYELATPETQEGAIWESVFNELERYPKCKVFFKKTTEPGPDREPETVWLIKVDHSARGIQFEAKSRIEQEAAGRVYDYLAGDLEDEGKTGDAGKEIPDLGKGASFRRTG